MWYSSPVPWGIVQPRGSVEVPLTLEAQVTGEQDTVAHAAVFGSEGSPLVSSRGRGPLCDSSWWGVKRKAGLLIPGILPGKARTCNICWCGQGKKGFVAYATANACETKSFTVRTEYNCSAGILYSQHWAGWGSLHHECRTY